jgi:DNA-binding response OmpR family regulator
MAMPETANQGAGDVLIIDDEPAIVEMLEELLTDEGYVVRSAGDAATAWRAIQEQAPALLLLDILMPGNMDGADLARKLRAEGYTLPIIIIAATDERARPLLHLAPISYIGKPFDLDRLLRGVARYLAPAQPDVAPPPRIMPYQGPAIA